MDYTALTITATNDKAQTRSEEKNALGQTLRVTDASGAQIAYQHDAFGNLIKTRDALQNIVTLAYDIRGRKVAMTDPDSGLWSYDYDALGQLVRQQNPTQRAAATYTTLAYDKLGRLTQRTEPEYTSTWTYDQYATQGDCNKGIGRLCLSATTGGTANITRKHVYDAVGRPINTRTDLAGGPSVASAVAYDATTGRFASRTWPSGLQVKYNYTTGTVKGYLDKLTLGTALTVNPLPTTPGGTPGASAGFAINALLWQPRILNAWGGIEEQLHGAATGGSSLTGKTAFDPATGRITDRSAGAGASTTVLDQHTTWDSVNNLASRTDDNGDGSTGQVKDTYAYDSLNRMTGYTVQAQSIAGASRSVALHYNALGMLLYRSDTGNYAYPAQAGVRPHALQSLTATSTTSYTYDDNGNLRTASAGKYRNLTYTSFNLPDSSLGLAGPSNSPRYTWAYDENHARIREVRTIASGTYAGTRTTWMLHPDNAGSLAFESEVNSPTVPSAANPAMTSNRHYLSAGGQAIGVIVSTGALPTPTANQTAPNVQTSMTVVKVETWHKDHLGSIAATTDHHGNLTARYAYEPMGKRRLTNGKADLTDSLLVDWSPAVNAGTDRGFTGHEQLDDVALVHMNGRLYDARLGLFLQADPLIQDAGNLQGFNRYGYCLNNPLNCTDPSGYSWWTDNRRMIIGIAVAIAVPQLLPELMITLAGGEVTLFVTMSGGSVFSSAAVVLTPLGNFTVAAISGFASGAISSGNVQGGLQGAFTAGLFYGAGDLISGSGAFAGNAPIGDQFAQVTVHGVAGCVSSVASGNKCGPGAMAAAFSKFATVNGFVGQDVVSGTITSAVVGGTASVLGGGKFANGAQTGAFGYLFNCLNHPGVCTKADQPDIRRAAAACGGDSSCIRQLAMYARESGIPAPPDLAQALRDFMDISTLPVRVFTPAGRVADDLIDAAKFVTGSASEQAGIAAGAAYEKAMERVTRGFNVPAATEPFAKIMGKIFESAAQSASQEAVKKPPKP